MMPVFWHITTYENIPLVMSEGLRPSKSIKGRTILFPKKKWAYSIVNSAWWRNRKTQGYALIRAEIPPGWVYGTWLTRRRIPPGRLRIVKDLGSPVKKPMV